MAQAKMETKQTTDTRGRNALIGGGVGGAAGLVTWLIAGGVGVATGGVGSGLGALGLTALGVGAGAAGGAATGTKAIIVQSTALYSPWAWGAVFCVDVIMCFIGAAETKELVLEWKSALHEQA
jgi:hypothetical protein